MPFDTTTASQDRILARARENIESALDELLSVMSELDAELYAARNRISELETELENTRNP
jgi:hypothetical protein